MLKKLQNVLSSDLIIVFSFTSISTIIKMLANYVSIKIVASIIGPSGIALVGQLQNFINISTTLGAGGINNGITKYVAENNDNYQKQVNFIGNGFKITVIFSLAFGLLMIVGSGVISRWILFDEKYRYVFILMGITLIFLSLNNYFLSVLNGFKQYKTFVIINIVTSLVGLIFTVILVLKYHLDGAFVALVTFQSIVLVITLFFLRKVNWLSLRNLWPAFDKDSVKRLLSFSLMAFVTAATVPVSQIFVRSYILKEFTIVDAGFWEGMNRISNLILTLITTSFSVYYLPKISELKEESSLRAEIIKTFKIMAPLIFVGLLGMYLLRDLVIWLLFSEEFTPMRSYFFWQLLGDFFKLMSWILAFVMVAKSMIKVFIVTEVLFAVLFVALSVFFIKTMGPVGVTYGYCANYFFYLLVMIILFRKLLFNIKST